MTRYLNAFYASICLALTAAALAGCGAVEQAQQAAQQSQKRDQLRMMGVALHNHYDAMQKGPAGWDEFIDFAKGHDPAAGAALEELRGDGVVFYCDVKFIDAKGGMSNSIFAFEPSAPQSGGLVLLLDGSVMQMSADDFNAVLAAQQKESPATVAKRSN